MTGRILLWIIIPLCNFFFWYFNAVNSPDVIKCRDISAIGRTPLQIDVDCDPSSSTAQVVPVLDDRKSSTNNHIYECSHLDMGIYNSFSPHADQFNESAVTKTSHSSYLTTVNSVLLDSWRADRMASMTYHSDDSVVIHGRQINSKNKERSFFYNKDNRLAGSDCTSIDMQWVSVSDDRCMAVVKVQGVYFELALSLITSIVGILTVL